MKRFAIALTAFALALPAAWAQSGGGAGGSGGSSGSGGSAGSGGTSGSSGSAGTGSASGAGGVGQGSGVGQSGIGQGASGQAGRAGTGVGSRSDGLGGRSDALGDGSRSPLTDRQLDSGGQSGQATTNRGQSNQPGRAGQTGRFDDPAGIADQQQLGRDAGQFGNRTFDDRRFDDRGLGDRPLNPGQDDLRTRDRLDRDDRFGESGAANRRTNRLDDSPSGSGPGAADRQRGVQWIAGRWWFQRNSGEWLAWDPRASEWRNFNPRLLEQSGR